MAYIERRQSGYMVQIRRKGMRQLSRTFDLKADAEAWARDVERELQRGNAGVLNDDAGKTLLRELLDLYENGPLLLLKEPGKNRAALRAARDQFGSSFLSSIRAVDIAVWRDQLMAGGLASATVLRYLAVLSTVFSFAEKELSIVLPIGNPVHSVRKPAKSWGTQTQRRPRMITARG